MDILQRAGLPIVYVALKNRPSLDQCDSSCRRSFDQAFDNDLHVDELNPLSSGLSRQLKSPREPVANASLHDVPVSYASPARL